MMSSTPNKRSTPRRLSPSDHSGYLADDGASVDGCQYRGVLADDKGSALLLTIFYAFLSLVLIFLVVAATSLYLERKRLFTLADGAALVGAESYDLDDIELTSTGYRPKLTADKVAAAVTDYVTSRQGDGFTELQIEQATTKDSASSTVSLAAYWKPPLVSLLVPEGIRIDVTATARSVFS